MRNIADIAINAMRNAGANKAQVTVSRAKKTELNIEQGELSLMRTTFANSVSLVAIKDSKKGTSRLGSWDEEAVKAAAEEAVEMADAGQADSAYDIALSEDGDNNFNAGLDEPESCFLPRIVALQKTVARDFPKIICDYYAAFNRTEKLIANTNGVELMSSDGRYDIQAMFSAKEGETVTSFSTLDGNCRSLPENLMDFLNFRDFLEQSMTELGAKPIGDKFVGEVIFQPECLFELLQSYASCFLEDASLIGQTSLLKDKLGQKIASDIVNLRVIPLNKEICGTFVSNDGFSTKNMDVIKNGVLENFLLTQYGSSKTSQKRAGCTLPFFEMDAGDVSLNDMIAGVKRGLFLSGRISGGTPSENGTFSGVAKNSFMIEDGKVTYPVQETMISGNVLEIFMNISEISKERRSNGIFNLPWVKAGDITIS
jgi:PmbA protein